MPYTYAISPEERFARIRLLGTVEGREITAAWHAVVSDPLWKRGFGSLWDASGISLHILLDDIEAFSVQAGEHSKLRGPGRTAIVTTDVSVHINALLLCLKSKGGQDRAFRIFQCVGDAEAWLGEVTTDAADLSREPPSSVRWEERSGYLVRVATHPGEGTNR